MRNKILFTLTALLLMATGMRAQTPYAVYGSGTLTFKYDKNKPEGQEGVYDLADPGWLKHKLDITTVVFEKSFKEARPTTCYQWFYGFKKLTTIVGLENLNTSSVRNMSFMFYNCESLTTLNLNDFNTENVADMSYMFSGCKSLTSLTFGEKFNTENVRDMSYMFCNCINLGSLDLSKLNTANVTNMNSMFFSCIKLESLDLGSFDTEKVTNMKNMFSYCNVLETIYVSDKFKIGENTLSTEMFDGCYKLNKNDEDSYFTLRSAYAVYCEGDKSLHFLCSETELNENDTFTSDDGQEMTITKVWSGEDVTKISINTFPAWNNNSYPHFSPSYQKVVLEKSFKTVRPTNCYHWFHHLSKDNTLTEIVGIENLNTSEVTNMQGMFWGCDKLTSLNLSNFDTKNVTDNQHMFYGCSSLESLDLSCFEINHLHNMFNQCNSLKKIKFGKGLNIKGEVTDNGYFTDCNALRLLDLSNSTGDFSRLEKENSQINEAALIYVPEGTDGTIIRDKNVVVGNTCEQFVIDVAKDDNQLLLCTPYEFTAKKITINRKFIENEAHTLCLPFAMSATNYGKFYTYYKYDNDSKKAIFKEFTGTMTTPNTPYLFIPNNTYEDGIVIENETTVEVTPEEMVAETKGEDGSSFHGIYEKKAFTEDEANEMVYYGWVTNIQDRQNDGFYRAGEGAKVDACRAYLKLPASNAPARLSVKFEDENTTGIINIEREDSGTESPIYNLNGQRVGNSYRGVVIKNGKKIVNRAQ